jgi:hypothetical protein
MDGEWMVIGWWLERTGRKDPEPETKKVIMVVTGGE